MSRRRSRLASTATPDANREAISVDEFLKGLNRTPRKQRYQYRRGHFSLGSDPASSNIIPSTSPARNVDEDEFLLETLAALERANEEVAQPGDKQGPGITRCVPPRKRKRMHAVAWGSLALSRDPQNDTFRSSSDSEMTDLDPIMTGTTQVEEHPDAPSRPHFPVSVLRGMILSPRPGQASGLKGITDGRIIRVIPRETRKSWADQIDGALVPREATTTPIARKPKATMRGALELVNSSACLEDDSELLPHPALAMPRPSTPDFSPSGEGCVAEIDMGPDLGLIKAPEKAQEYSRSTTGNNMRALSDHLKRFPTSASLIATKILTGVAGGNSDIEVTSGSGTSKLDMGVAGRGSTPKATGDTIFPGPVGIDSEGGASAGGKRHKGTSAAPLSLLSREGVQGIFSQPVGIRPSSGFRASDCPSKFEAQVAPRAHSVQGVSGDPESVVDPPHPKGKVGAGCGHQDPGVVPNEGSSLLQKQRREVDRDHSTPLPTRPFQGDWQKPVPFTSPLCILPATTPPPPKNEVAAPDLPSHRRLRNLVDEGGTGGMESPHVETYFSSAQRSLVSAPRFGHHAPRNIQFATSPSRHGYGSPTDNEEIDEECENEPNGASTKSVNRPAIYSLSPTAISTPARNHTMISLKDILKRGASFQTRRPSTSGIFRKPSLLPRPLQQRESTFVPPSPQAVLSGQQDSTRRPLESSLFIVPSSIVPSTFASETDNRVKRRMARLRSDAFGEHFSDHQGGSSGANRPIIPRPRRGMTVRFDPSQKPFRLPLVRRVSQTFGVRNGVDRPLQSSARTRLRQPYPEGPLAKAGGNQHAHTNNLASFVDVRAAW